MVRNALATNIFPILAFVPYLLVVHDVRDQPLPILAFVPYDYRGPRNALTFAHNGLCAI